MKKLLMGCASAIAILSWSSVGANAANVDIANVGFIGVGVDLNGTINGSPFHQDNVNAGLITLTTTGGSILPVFCIDLFHDIGIQAYNPPLPYTTGTIVADSSSNPSGTGGNPLVAPIPGEIQALANLGYGDYVHGAGSQDIYAALQGAIWSIEYNANGNILAVDGGATVNAQITADIAYAQAHPASYSVSLFPGKDGVAFGSGQGFTPGVPEPATWAMMLLGFASLGFAGYRRNANERVKISA
jgi:hypothetical protein